MHQLIRRLMVSAVLLTPAVSTAQVSMQPTPPPTVTAADASWQRAGDPVIYSGAFYYPSGPVTFFDGNVMTQTMTYQGVPVYTNATLEINSILFVPIGNGLVRPYERRREVALAATASPFQASRNVVAVSATEPVPLAASAARTPAGTNWWIIVRRPSSNDGIWLTYEGTRWYNVGRTASYSADGFVQIGEYYGFPVYRARGVGADAGEIYIMSVANGPLARFRARK